ncbi:MAG: hypothetical protein Q9209_006118 [Squamulea sp. 1 TL-2023]
MSDCCISGFSWNGVPSGYGTKIGNFNVYPAGDNKDVAILFLHDLFGWTFRNNRLLADHLAREVNATVLLPDFFDGEVVSDETIFDPEKFKNFDLDAWKERNNKENRASGVHQFTKMLKVELGFKKVGAIGYCWGRWAAFQLGAKGKGLIDVISVAHHSSLTKEEIDNVAVPVQILAPEIDPRLTPELKEYVNKVIPTLGLEYDYQYFPSLVHGFACRAVENNDRGKRGFGRAKNAASGWFAQMLQGRRCNNKKDICGVW